MVHLKKTFTSTISHRFRRRCMRDCHGPVELCSIRWCPRPSSWIPPLGQCNGAKKKHSSRRLPWLRLGWIVHGKRFNCGPAQDASNKARIKSGVRSHGQRCNQVHEATVSNSAHGPGNQCGFSPLLNAMLCEDKVPSKCHGLSWFILIFMFIAWGLSPSTKSWWFSAHHSTAGACKIEVWLGIETDPWPQAVNFYLPDHRWSSMKYRWTMMNIRSDSRKKGVSMDQHKRIGSTRLIRNGPWNFKSIFQLLLQCATPCCCGIAVAYRFPPGRSMAPGSRGFASSGGLRVVSITWSLDRRPVAQHETVERVTIQFGKIKLVVTCTSTEFYCGPGSIFQTWNMGRFESNGMPWPRGLDYPRRTVNPIFVNGPPQVWWWMPPRGSKSVRRHSQLNNGQ